MYWNYCKLVCLLNNNIWNCDIISNLEFSASLHMEWEGDCLHFRAAVSFFGSSPCLHLEPVTPS
jgi:hypothetical protein